MSRPHYLPQWQCHSSWQHSTSPASAQYLCCALVLVSTFHPIQSSFSLKLNNDENNPTLPTTEPRLWYWCRRAPQIHFIALLPSLLSVSVFCIYGRIADMSTTSEMVDMTIKEQEPKNKQTCHCKRRQKFQLDSNSNKQQIELSQIQIQSFLMIKAKGCQVPQLSYLMNWNVLSQILSRYPTILYRWQRLPSSCLGTWDKAHLK